MESERRTPNAQRPMAEDQKSDPPKDGFAVAKVRGQTSDVRWEVGTTRPRDNRTTRQ
jgi:hypothetical protein